MAQDYCINVEKPGLLVSLTSTANKHGAATSGSVRPDRLRGSRLGHQHVRTATRYQRLQLTRLCPAHRRELHRFLAADSIAPILNSPNPPTPGAKRRTR